MIPDDDLIELVVHRIVNEIDISSILQSEKILNKERDKLISSIQKIMDQQFHKKDIYVEGDPIIQIGTVFHRYGEKEPYLRHILVIGPKENMKKEDICDSMSDLQITVHQCITEKELLLDWSKA